MEPYKALLWLKLEVCVGGWVIVEVDENKARGHHSRHEMYKEV